MKLSSFEKRWAVAIMEGFAPSGNPGFSPHVGEVDYLSALLAMATASTKLAQTGLRMALWVIALSPLWMLGKARTIVSLPAAERSAVLERLMAHPFYLVRELGIYLKLATCMALFSKQSLRDRSNYYRRSTAPDSGKRVVGVRLPLLQAKGA